MLARRCHELKRGRTDYGKVVEYTVLGEQLRAMRQRAGLTSVQLAGRLGVSYAAVNNYEHGRRKIPLPLAERWARECGSQLELTVSNEAGAVPAGLTRREHELLEAVRLLASAEIDMVLALARVLPGHPVARQAVRAAVDVLASTPAPEARGPPSEPANDEEKAVPRTA